jgi:signal transduction histidine kinase
MAELASILVVDDEPVSLKLLEAALSSLPVSVVTTQSGEEALALAEEGEEFAAVLLDVVMPGMDGFETAARLRRLETLKLTPILFMTALEKDERQVAKAYALGAADYILKPIVPEILRAKVEVFLKLFEPVRQLKRWEHELRRSNQNLQEFAYVVSHDLQEPLRTVASYTQLLARRYRGKLDADADQFIAYAVDGAERMQRLIDDLLVLSRVGSRGGRFEPADCEAALAHAADNLKVAIEESRAALTHDPLPTVAADEGQLVQLFQNLVANAIKFHGEAPPRVHVSAEQNAGEWILAVEDNGIGIDAEHFDRIFTIFQRLHTRQEYSGTGIGLAICRRIVEGHGGRIWVASEPGKGSTFYFTLPASLGKN